MTNLVIKAKSPPKSSPVFSRNKTVGYFVTINFTQFFIDAHTRESKALANYSVWQILSFLLNLINAERLSSEVALKENVKVISIFTFS